MLLVFCLFFYLQDFKCVIRVLTYMRFAISTFLLAYLLALWCQLPTYLHFNTSNENNDTEGTWKNLQSEGSDGDHFENVKGGRDEQILQNLIDQINAEPHYRVVTKEEYDFLRLRRAPTCTPKFQQGLFHGIKPKLLTIISTWTCSN